MYYHEMYARIAVAIDKINSLNNPGFVSIKKEHYIFGSSHGGLFDPARQPKNPQSPAYAICTQLQALFTQENSNEQSDEDENTSGVGG